jgi:hypothetical protein
MKLCVAKVGVGPHSSTLVAGFFSSASIASQATLKVRNYVTHEGVEDVKEWNDWLMTAKDLCEHVRSVLALWQDLLNGASLELSGNIAADTLSTESKAMENAVIQADQALARMRVRLRPPLRHSLVPHARLLLRVTSSFDKSRACFVLVAPPLATAMDYDFAHLRQLALLPLSVILDFDRNTRSDYLVEQSSVC